MTFVKPSCLALVVAAAAATALDAGCAADSQSPAPPEPRATTSAADITSSTLYSITLESITPVVLAYAPSYNHYHFHLEATGVDASSAARPAPALWTNTFPTADAEFDNVVAGASYPADPRGAPVLGNFPVVASAQEFVRFVALGEADVSDVGLYQDPLEHTLPTYTTLHPQYMKQVRDYMQGAFFNPTDRTIFQLDTAPALIPGAPQSQGPDRTERTCAGPIFNLSFVWSGAELFQMTQTQDNTVAIEGDLTYSDPWDTDTGDGCGPRPETKYRIVIRRTNLFAPLPPPCNAQALVPADTNDQNAWVGDWGDKPALESSRVTAEIVKDSGWLDVTTHEVVHLARTTNFDSMFIHEVPFPTTNLPDYTGHRFPSLIVPIGQPPPHVGRHDVLMSDPLVTLEAYTARCVSGAPARRMRYMRRSSFGSLVTDVMLQPSQHAPK
jgi:hypothetical protein